MRSRWAWAAIVGAGAAASLVWQKRRRDANASARLDRQVNEASDDSFPASDPPSHTPTMGSAVARGELT